MVKRAGIWLLVTSLLLLTWPLVARAQGSVHKTDELVAMLRKAVHSQYQIPEHDVMIIWNDETLEAKLAKIGTQTVLQVMDSDLVRAVGKKQFLFAVMQQGRFKAKITLKISVDGWVPALSTRRAMSRGEIFSEENLLQSRRRLSEMPKLFLNSADMVIGNEATQNLPANTVIHKQLVKERPVILKGSQIKVYVVSGSLTLTAQGITLEDGYRGRMVKVQVLNFSGKKIVQAQVLNANEVKIMVD